MPIEVVVEKYLQLIKTEDFAKYEEDFTSRVQKGLKKGYRQRDPEPTMVSIVKGIINNLDGLSVSTNGVKISTKSIFIHGIKSQVEFEYQGQRVQRELGDLIFILSVIYKGIKYFEKFTISQFKKDNNKFSWNLSNKEQIYLLSHFPSFRGVRGSIIPMREFNLPNYSGCLGSFNLLFRPGDFVFISAPLLERLVGNRKSIDRFRISQIWEPPCYCFHYPTPFDWLYIFWRRKVCGHESRSSFFPHCCCMCVLGFCRFASNIREFVYKYLRGNIGELIYSDIGIYNAPAFYFLHELLSAIMRKAEQKENAEIIKFIKEFFGPSYRGNDGGMGEGVEFDYEGGGIGIIYTSINLGEVE
jgi:hypothetical protein